METNQLAQKAIALLKELIIIPSYSRDEDAVAEKFVQIAVANGEEPIRDKNNVYFMTEYDDSKPTILLNSHLDTVKPSSSWTQDPHGAEVEGDVLYGLGSNDAGASVVSLFAAYMALSKKDQAYNLIFLASAEEEVSGKDGVEYMLPKLPKIDFAIVGEPTEMHPAVAEKGLMVIDGVAKGKSGHAAREEGINAIYIALEDVKWASQYKFPRVSDMLGPVKMSVTQIDAGDRHNVVPDKCHFVMDVRSNEKYSNEEVFDIIQSNMKSELKARSYRLNSSFTEEKHPFLVRAKKMGRKPYGSPTLSDQCLMAFSSVKMGPGQSARSHTADEFIKLSEIEEAVALYIEVLDGLVL